MLVAAVSVLLLGALLYDRHNFVVRWPVNIQRQTIGSTVATSAQLLTKERDFAYGEGFARWKYRADASSKALQRLCGATVVSHCSFNRSHSPQEGVTSSVSLSGGVLTIEEWWS